MLHESAAIKKILSETLRQFRDVKVFPCCMVADAHFTADPDTSFHCYAAPDQDIVPASHQSDANLRLLFNRPSMPPPRPSMAPF